MRAGRLLFKGRGARAAPELRRVAPCHSAEMAPGEKAGRMRCGGAVPLDLSLFALRLQDISDMANSAIRERNKNVANEYQYEIIAIARELLDAVEADLRETTRAS